ncbi:MAG: DHH family phosphoesterase [Clostridiales bacterium]|nr:DHH family phosphoesterase [Clostridiales bacterium]
MKKLTITEAARFLAERDDFLIISHRRPDGDAIGSSAGLCCGLREMGKRAYLLPNPQITEKFIPYAEEFYAPEDFEYGCLVSTDLADEGIIQLNAESLCGKVELSIDHHPSNSGYAGTVTVLPEKASCGEVVQLILKELPCGVSRKTAEMLYFAIATDCGCFRYKNTTAETLRAAAELIDLGIPSGSMNKKLFMTKSRGRLLLEGQIITGMEFHMDGELVIAVVSDEMISACGATEDDLDDVAVIAGQAEGVETSITLRQTETGWKASVRTVDYPNANAICAQLGGGGHGMAAGCSMDCGLEEAKRRILEATKKVWKQA